MMMVKGGNGLHEHHVTSRKAACQSPDCQFYCSVAKIKCVDKNNTNDGHKVGESRLVIVHAGASSAACQNVIAAEHVAFS